MYGQGGDEITSESTRADWERSKAFYDKVLGVLGFTRQMDYQVAIGYGVEGKPDFWIAGSERRRGDGSQPRDAFSRSQAADTGAVQAFYDAALELGADSLHAPRLWPEYHPGYFWAFVRDPDGNNVEAVFHGAAPAMSDAAEELLRDSFTRLVEHVDELTDGLSDEMSWWRPVAGANSIAWLIWHSARQHDVQLADIAGTEQVWIRDGWRERFGLDLPGNDMGYGQYAGRGGQGAGTGRPASGVFPRGAQGDVGVHRVHRRRRVAAHRRRTAGTRRSRPAPGWSASSTTALSTSVRPSTSRAP